MRGILPSALQDLKGQSRISPDPAIKLMTAIAALSAKHAGWIAANGARYLRGLLLMRGILVHNREGSKVNR